MAGGDLVVGLERDGLAQRRDAAVVEVRRRIARVAQRRHAERAAVGTLAGDLEATEIAPGLGQPDRVAIALKERRLVAAIALELAEQREALSLRLAQRARVAGQVRVVRRVVRDQRALKRRERGAQR